MSKKSIPVIKDRDIAIVGMSCLFPKARNLNEFWTNIVSKKIVSVIYQRLIGTLKIIFLRI